MDQSTVDTRCLEFCGVWKKKLKTAGVQIKNSAIKVITKSQGMVQGGVGGVVCVPRTNSCTVNKRRLQTPFHGHVFLTVKLFARQTDNLTET